MSLAASPTDPTPDTTVPLNLDATGQLNLQVLGLSPAVAASAMYLSTATALSNAAYNATVQQQAANAAERSSTLLSTLMLISSEISSLVSVYKDMNRVRGL